MHSVLRMVEVDSTIITFPLTSSTIQFPSREHQEIEEIVSQMVVFSNLFIVWSQLTSP